MNNFVNEDYNPCIEESNLSMKCLEAEMYDYSKCKIFFENYKNCKKFWGNICKKRQAAGISPALPTKNERDKILREKEKGIFIIAA